MKDIQINYLLYNNDETIISYGDDSKNFLQYKVASDDEVLKILYQFESLGAVPSVNSEDKSIYINYYSNEYITEDKVGEALENFNTDTLRNLLESLKKAVNLHGVSYEFVLYNSDGNAIGSIEPIF